MPFMKGLAAMRRTLPYLENGEILLRDNIKVLMFNFNVAQQSHVEFTLYPYTEESKDEKFNHHSGLSNFVYWHLPQLKYKNPNTQLVTFNQMTPTPFIKAFTEDGDNILIDCDSRSRQEIHDHVKVVLGKSAETLEEELAEREQLTANPANFGLNYPLQCACDIPGQVACPGWKKLPHLQTGKWQRKLAQGEEVPPDD